MTDDLSAALLIRVWREEDDDAFRARLTAVGGPRGDAPVDEMTVAVAASPHEVVAAVGRWLDGFLRDPPGSAGNGPAGNGSAGNGSAGNGSAGN